MSIAIGTVALGNQTGSITLDASQGNRFTLTATGDLTIGITNTSPGQPYSIVVTEDATGSRLIQWAASVTVQGFVPLGNGGAGGVNIYSLIGSGYSSADLVSFSTFSDTGNNIQSENDTDIYAIPGYNTTAHSGGATAGVRRGFVFQCGILGNQGGYNGKGAYQTWNHAVSGTIEDKQMFGTAGSPDTGLYVRWAYPFGVRYQLTGNSTTFCLYESVSGASWYHDFDTATGNDRWRTSAAATILDISAIGGVSFGVAGVANMVPGATQYLGIAAPSASPAAGNEIRWLDTTTARESRKNSVGTYNVGYLGAASAVTGTSGAIAIDATKSNVHTVTATGNITITFSNGVPGDDITFIFTQDGAGGRTLTLGAGVSQATGVTITANAAIGAVSVYKFTMLTATTAILTSASRA